MTASSPPPVAALAHDLFTLAGGDPATATPLDVSGPEVVLDSSFHVTSAAAAIVGAATMAMAELGESDRAAVDTVGACLAFQSERHLDVPGERPALWDPLAGYYDTTDGHIQFHTNFAHHRAGMLRAIGLDPDQEVERAEVEEAVGGWAGDDLELAVNSQGGISAALRSLTEWHAHPQAAHVATQPLIESEQVNDARATAFDPPADRPLSGVRVLDLTRVIAGPVCTRTLAAYGADVLRVGAPDLPVISVALPDTMLGKRFCALDLTDDNQRRRVLELAAEADIVVNAFRPGALDRFGLGTAALFERNTSLIVAELCAFGWDGPWGGRRGFDSITQSATGIVAEETSAFSSPSSSSPARRPLPCQLLDHGTGFLTALGVVRALSDRRDEPGGRLVRTSLLRTRQWLESLGRTEPNGVAAPDGDLIDDHRTTRTDVDGHEWVAHVDHPGSVDGVTQTWERGPSITATDEPVWLDR